LPFWLVGLRVPIAPHNQNYIAAKELAFFFTILLIFCRDISWLLFYDAD
jgi:hypothetical protein